MIHLKVPTHSTMDLNLEADWNGGAWIGDMWISYIKSLPHVKNAEWNVTYTLITFESEADKTWFIMRWS